MRISAANVTNRPGLILVGGGLTLYRPMSVTGSGWNRYSVPLTEEGWQLNSESGPTPTAFQMHLVLLSLVGSGQIASERVRITSTGGMTTIAGGRPGTRTVLVATETGMLHQLRKLSPTTRWEPVDDDAICPYMKMTDADALLHSLRTGTVEIEVDPVIAERARASVEKMIAIGSPSRGGE